MNRIKKYFTVKWCAMISALLGMLGYAACGSKDEEDGLGPCLYGQPHAYFKVEGTVLNEDGLPMKGIKVYVRDNYGDTARTDQNGKYVFEDTYIMPYTNMWVMAKDPYGVYATDSVSVATDFQGGSDWYSGSYSTTQNFTLKKKPAEPEVPETPEETTEPETQVVPETPTEPETPSNPEE